MINIKNIIDKIYVTTCGRVFVKDDGYKNMSFHKLSIVPNAIGALKRFCDRKNIKMDDFDKIPVSKDKYNKVLYLFKYKHSHIPFEEVKYSKDSDGYLTFGLFNKRYKLHRVVNFYYNHINNHEMFHVNHIDGIKTNNFVSNLEWCTPKENIHHAWSMGLSKRTDEQNRKMSKTNLNKIPLDIMKCKEYKNTKTNIKIMLKVRGLNFENFEFIKTGKNKTNHALGYIKEK